MLVVLRSDRPLMAHRRRISIQRQSGGALQLPPSFGIRSPSSNRSLVSPANSVANTVTSLESFDRAGLNSGKPGHPPQVATMGDHDFSGSAGCFHVLYGDYDTMFKWLQMST